jgi:hypothetical protein
LFAADITRERTAIALRLQAEAARKRLRHRQEREEAREYAAAETLSSLKHSSDKVHNLIYFHQLGLLTPVKTKLVIRLGPKLPNGPIMTRDNGSTFIDEDSAMPAPPSSPAGLSFESEKDDMPMLVDSPHEARFS